MWMARLHHARRGDVVLKPRTYVAIPGTWGWQDRQDPAAWFQPTSAFAAAMRATGCVPLRPQPFVWTTRINGDAAWRRWLAPVLPRALERGDTKDWESAADNLVYYCEAAAPPDVIIAHSHAGQILAYAAARHGLTVPLAITVSTPVRADMKREYFALHRAAGAWRHLYDRRSDWIAWLGMIGDGALLGDRAMPYASDNIALDGVSHTGLLNDPDKLGLWLSEGWLA